MKRVLGLLLLIVHSFAFEFDEFSSFQGKLSKEYVTGKISRYLQYNQEIENYFEIQDDALVLFKSPEAKRQGIYEFRLVFGKENSKSSVKSKPLDKVRIAIDPGHFGGQFARLEERFIDVDFEGTHLEIDEGRLSFLTAMRLKELLEKAGVSVMVTRKKIGEGVYSEDFFDWLKAHPEYWEKGVALSEIFRRHYNRLDLRERARVINEYRPDLTVVIHYNHVGGGEGQITEKNFNFIWLLTSKFLISS
ncbi:MAG: N-acetylmuramoyl-L-alanine amidase [Chlamydiia bacterium]|nr:N-acetylmuramoyl-L-alanine amidase [Chlamydiia bacterium]